MNKVELIGRIARDVDVRYSNNVAVARYTLAVDRRSRNGEKEADFISIAAFGKAAEFAEKYLHKGMKLAVTGRIQTGSYDKADGTKVYTTDVIAEEQEFVEKRQDAQNGGQNQSYGNRQTNSQSRPQNGNYGDSDAFKNDSGFMDIPEGFESGVPFN